MVGGKGRGGAEFAQFSLLLLGLMCMGAGLGFERSLLPRMAVDIFHETSASSRLNFVATFGLFKAVANVVSGPLADRYGRKPTLALGFAIGLPVMPYIIVASDWTGITVMNAAFGLSQGLLGSALFFLLIDVMGPSQRGVAVGIGECAIFVTTAVVNVWAGRLASVYGYRPVPFVWATAFCVVGLFGVVPPLRDTLDKVLAEERQRGAGDWPRGGSSNSSDSSSSSDSSDSSSSDSSDSSSTSDQGEEEKKRDGRNGNIWKDEEHRREVDLAVTRVVHVVSAPDNDNDDNNNNNNDDDDDLSDEAETLEYGLVRNAEKETVAAAAAGGSVTDTTTTTNANVAAAAAAGHDAEAPTMQRAWSGDFQDFESDLERMLKSVRSGNGGGGSKSGGGTEESPSRNERRRRHHRRRQRQRQPPSSKNSAMSWTGEGSDWGSNDHYDNYDDDDDDDDDGDKDEEEERVRLISDTRWARYMSVEPPSAIAAMAKTHGAESNMAAMASPTFSPPPPPPPPPPPRSSTALPTTTLLPDTMLPDPPMEVMMRLLTNTNYVCLCATGMACNFKDGFAWGTFPVFFSNVHHLSDSRTDLLIALYPLCWGLAQAFTGAASDKYGRQLFLTLGMASCTIAMLLFVLPQLIWGGGLWGGQGEDGDGNGNGGENEKNDETSLGDIDAVGFVWIVADILLGLGTALAYPALQAGAADEVDPRNRGLGLGFYRFVRDMGYVAGALVCGRLTDAIGYEPTFVVVAAVLGAATYSMAVSYVPRRRTVLIGGGRRIVLLKKEESVAAMSVGYAD